MLANTIMDKARINPCITKQKSFHIFVLHLMCSNVRGGIIESNEQGRCVAIWFNWSRETMSLRETMWNSRVAVLRRQR